MPIYDYQCRDCGHQFEMVVLRSTAIACPACQSANLEQLLSAFAVNSEGIRQANASAARRSAVKSRDFKEKNHAEAEYIKKHND